MHNLSCVIKKYAELSSTITSVLPMFYLFADCVKYLVNDVSLPLDCVPVLPSVSMGSNLTLFSDIRGRGGAGNGCFHS